eukprot:scaffold2643_cov117-Isochrysis_galbana.AAC.10
MASVCMWVCAAPTGGQPTRCCQLHRSKVLCAQGSARHMGCAWRASLEGLLEFGRPHPAACRVPAPLICALANALGAPHRHSREASANEQHAQHNSSEQQSHSGEEGQRRRWRCPYRKKKSRILILE